MSKTRLLLFISLLLLATLACNALDPVARDETGDTAVNRDQVVDEAVATVQAQIGSSNDGSGETSVTVAPPRAISVTTDLESSLVGLYERANPAVVFITTNDGSLRLGSGSGFVYDDQGHIITNNHVVAEGDNYEVQFADGDLVRAELVGTDVHSDLAVLRVESRPDNAQPLPLADFNSLRVGQFVVAIGNPFEEQGSLSFGVISGLGRSIISQELAENGGFYTLPEVVQTDAPINPGNSGGPLLNLSGEVVGVNSAIRSTTGLNTGVGFAIPVAAVQRIVPALVENGSYAYPWMGIGSSGGPINLERQQQLGLPEAYGVYVTSVTSASPAEEAGIIPAPNENTAGGDLIIGIDDRQVREFNDLLSYLIFETEVGQTIDLTVVRDGETITVPLTLSERP
ncbi:MAG: S1C family serine protease [Chloroflexota bacterium]